MSKAAALNRVGYVNSFNVKSKKINAKGNLGNRSTVILTIEADNDPKLIALLASIQRDGSAVDFTLAVSQAKIDFGEEE